MALLIGLTGGIGSGKTLVAALFRGLGAHIIDADTICRDLVKPGKPAWKEIRDAFGDQFFSSDQSLDRGKLAHTVFTDDSKRRLLEGILHPKVFHEEGEIYANICRIDPNALVLIDAALLIESGNYKQAHKVIVVRCAPETQVRRMMEYRSMPENEVRNRIRKQMPLEEKLKYADFVINNNEDDKEVLKAQVEEIYNELKSMAPGNTDRKDGN